MIKIQKVIWSSHFLLKENNIAIYRLEIKNILGKKYFYNVNLDSIKTWLTKIKFRHLEYKFAFKEPIFL